MTWFCEISYDQFCEILRNYANISMVGSCVGRWLKSEGDKKTVFSKRDLRLIYILDV